MAEYGAGAYPWPMMPEVNGKRLNQPVVSHGAVKTLLRFNGVCCGKVRFELEGSRKCPACKNDVYMEPGLVIDSSCANVIKQIRTLRQPRKPGDDLEQPEKQERAEDHAADMIRYMCYGAVLIMRAPPKAQAPPKDVDEHGRRVFHMPKRRERSGLAKIYRVS